MAGRVEGGSEREGGSNSVVESQPSKLLVAGSIPVSRSSLRPLRKWSKYRALEQFCWREVEVGWTRLNWLRWMFQPFVRQVGPGDSGTAGQPDSCPLVRRRALVHLSELFVGRCSSGGRARPW